jgi:ATP-binding cassette subfamily B protein
MNLIEEYFELIHTRKYSKYVMEMTISKINRISLLDAESQETQRITYMCEKSYEKSIESRKAMNSGIRALIFTLLVIFIISTTNMLFVGIFIIVLVTISILNVKLAKKTAGFWDEYMKNARRYNYFSDVLTQRDFASERKIFHFSDKVQRLFSDEFDASKVKNKRAGIIRFKYQLILESIVIGFSVFSLIYFVKPYSIGLLSLGAYVVLINGISSTLSAMSIYIGEYHNIVDFSKLKKQINTFWSKFETSNLSHYITQKEVGKKDRITLSSVNFNYLEGNNKGFGIKNFSFSFKEHIHYAIVGANGSGKTTLMKIILGLLKPSSGQITNILKDPKNLNIREQTVLFQDFGNYPITVREFVLMGNNKFTLDQRIFEALQKALIYDDIMSLEDGIDTSISLLSEKSTVFSKGQMQKLAIARVILSDSSLIILDEPTASLDPISERQIYEQYDSIFKEKTIIFVTHRLGAIKNMDIILMMDNGEIVEIGSHDELMKKGGVYSKMYNTQRELYE